MTVEAEPGFEAQRVARAEPDRHDLRLAQQPLGDSGRLLGRHRDLEPVLAGIAGAGDAAQRAGDRHLGGAHKRHALNPRREPRQHRGRRRALQCQERALELRLDRDRAIEICLQMREIGLLARRVDDEHQAIASFLGDARRHQIVEDAAPVVQQQRVAHLPRHQRLQIARDQRLQRARRLGAAQPDLTHMRDIEEAGLGARVQVLGDDAGGVLHRHLVAGERHHFGAARAVQLIQGRATQRCCGRVRAGFVQRAHLRRIGRHLASGRCPLCPEP